MARSSGRSPLGANGPLTKYSVACGHRPVTRRLPLGPSGLGDQLMSVELLTYAALGARLKISPEAARSLAKRLQLPRSLSHDGKALVSVDLAEIRHTPRPPGAHQEATSPLTAKIEALQSEIARLEARAADHRADFERE